jgi:hypothetical protein
MALERDLSTLLSLSSSLSSIFLALTEAVWADLFPPAPNFFSCWLSEGGEGMSHDENECYLLHLSLSAVGTLQCSSFIIYLMYAALSLAFKCSSTQLHHQKECQRNQKKNKQKNSQWPKSPWPWHELLHAQFWERQHVQPMNGLR